MNNNAMIKFIKINHTQRQDKKSINFNLLFNIIYDYTIYIPIEKEDKLPI